MDPSLLAKYSLQKVIRVATNLMETMMNTNLFIWLHWSHFYKMNMMELCKLLPMKTFKTRKKILGLIFKTEIVIED